MSSKTAYLIELANSAPIYVARGAGGDLFWTTDHERALQFPSKDAGEAFARDHLSGDLRVCEHMWA